MQDLQGIYTSPNHFAEQKEWMDKEAGMWSAEEKETIKQAEERYPGGDMRADDGILSQ